MGRQAPISVTVVAGNSPFLLAQIDNQEGGYLLPADVQSIAWALYNDSDTQVLTGAAEPSSTLFEELQLDSRWTKDDLGFNFEDQPDLSDFLTHTNINRSFRLEYVFTPPAPSIPFTIAFVLEVV